MYRKYKNIWATSQELIVADDSRTYDDDIPFGCRVDLARMRNSPGIAIFLLQQQKSANQNGKWN